MYVTYSLKAYICLQLLASTSLQAPRDDDEVQYAGEGTISRPLLAPRQRTDVAAVTSAVEVNLGPCAVNFWMYEVHNQDSRGVRRSLQLVRRQTMADLRRCADTRIGENGWARAFYGLDKAPNDYVLDTISSGLHPRLTTDDEVLA